MTSLFTDPTSTSTPQSSSSASSSKEVSGVFFKRGSSRPIGATATLVEGGGVRFTMTQQDQPELIVEQGEFRFAPATPGLPNDLELRDGSLFTPLDPEFRWKSWRNSRARVREWLERNPVPPLLAVLSIPAILAYLLLTALPHLLEVTVSLLPRALDERIGENISEAFHKPPFMQSTLSRAERRSLNARFDQAVATLPLEGDSYELYMRDIPGVGANAFAAPGGHIVLTDAMYRRLRGNEDLLMAILLHEIGHVEHRHGVEGVLRDLSLELLLSMVVGGSKLSERLLSGGTFLVDQAHSRDAESEADHFSFTHSRSIGVTPDDFAEAMERFSNSSTGAFEEFFRSHPASQERILRARQFEAAGARDIEEN